MPAHHTPLIATIAAGLVLAFLCGMVAHRLRLSPLVGYLVAGIAVGPFTPGFVADQGLANELAEIGVILLMFGVGLHFSLKDLMAVRAIAVPGAVVQIAVATLLGMGLAHLLGWGLGAGLVFGLALSVASTVVLVRALQERRIIETERGKIAVGWLIVEDLAMVLALVLLPAVGPALMPGGAALSAAELGLTFGITLAKVAAFVVVMLVAGRRLIPWIMHHAAHTGSRELFRLAVYAVALGVAYGAAVAFDVSFALGAFFAGMLMGESRLSQRAAEEALPLRDAFAVLFFVSVGMLFNPAVLVEQPLAVLATVLIIVIGKSAAAFGIVRAFGHPNATAMTISVSLAQIGEFSFILIGLGVTLGLVDNAARDLVLAGAILSILLNPFLFAAVEKGRARILTKIAFTRGEKAPAPAPAPPEATPPQAVPKVEEPAAPEPAQPEPPDVSTLAAHEVVVGYGRVGRVVGQGMLAAGRPLLVIEDADEAVEAARADGAEVVVGNAANPDVLAAANLPQAARLFVTVPEVFEAGQVVQQARALNPGLEILVRAHSDDSAVHLQGLGASMTVSGEREIALRMLERAGA
ncbi:cation:proton antiporter domain-containing protein [Falsiroseomonas selenitidurans]|uniref:Sodium:proton antiporter n=1 Tax=Falsiroseomonas selenitidurans TaxID=2716335 RepID=A0ABX1E8W7_9PROT|nr:cation:proton antiporter [Falsiroseomonas selenitidurans]NKC33639.1 sodium:proton antiporter [Falsiroseomonas selenitidurans]